MAWGLNWLMPSRGDCGKALGAPLRSQASPAAPEEKQKVMGSGYKINVDFGNVT